MHGAVLLGNTERPAKRIFLPRGAALETPLVGKCLLCGQTFYRGEEADYQRHAEFHVKHDLDEIRAMAPSEKAKGTLFDPADVDLELRHHWQRVRRRMAVDGRTEVRPSETAERGS